MAKWIIPLIIIICMVSGAYALEECKKIAEPKDIPCRVTSTWNYTGNCIDYNASVYNDSGHNTINFTLGAFRDSGLCNFTWNISESGSYTYLIGNGDSGNILIDVEDKMASIAIILFVLVISGGLFIIPFFKKEFVHYDDKFTNYWVNKVMRTGIWILAIYLFMMNSAIAATIADTAGLNLTKEMFRYMWFFGVAGWLGIFYLGFSSIIDIVKSYKINQQSKRDCDYD